MFPAAPRTALQNMDSLDDVIFWRRLFAADLLLLALIAYWPVPKSDPDEGIVAEVLALLHSSGVPAWFNFPFAEAAANICLFIPTGFAATWAFPGNSWWRNAVFGPLVSGGMELGQIFLPTRFPDLQDIVMNTLGMLLGLALAQAFIRSHQRQMAAALARTTRS